MTQDNEKKPKPMRYRKDLTAEHFKVQHDFRKGLRKLAVEPLYHGDIFDYLYFPVWERYAPGQFRFLSLQHRAAVITVLSNKDVKRVCNYIYANKQTVLNVFFGLVGLAVAKPISDEPVIYKIRYAETPSYAFVSSKIKFPL
ncbi:hypothetical protein [Seleniivibrio woodruffii]|uniref:Uncharacterized protein n=1 Tax=Seleniivibrio woodruffii TaxID=1078050 RepID=A0A4R1K309_9BACT|nr:hypothetical protein [Seleniivibrio woodruffii]TCK58456.1 hypothetical protein C8D98_2658 [Seleniivibrio woodruffii]TVZ36829.1 hypothetical protein OF66_2467 [Seleniivibrio woodruffii]